MRDNSGNSGYLPLAVVGLALLLTALSCVLAVAYTLAAPQRWLLLPDDTSLTRRGPGLEWSIVASEQPGGYGVSTIRVGWPLKCLVRLREHPEEPNTPGAVRIRPSYTHHRELINHVGAYRPIWYGLVGDITIFAAAIWMIRWGFDATRATIRARAGRCGRCGYLLRSIKRDTCPECGTRRRCSHRSVT